MANFPQNKHNIIGDIAEQKLATTNSFRVFGDSFFVRPSLDILTKHNNKYNASKASYNLLHLIELSELYWIFPSN